MKKLAIKYLQQNFLFFILVISSGLMGAIAVEILNIISLSLHKILFHIPNTNRLSALSWVNPWYCFIIPTLGGIGLWGVRKYFSSFFNPKIIDIIEANALYGGKISFKDSIYIAIQTIFSNGFGISLGLESAYTQLSSAFASKIGRFFQIQQNKLRLLVGCAAAGAIAAAFDSILGGAFYGFEIVLASYNLSNFPYVMLASIIGFMMMHWLGGAGPIFHIASVPVYWFDYGMVGGFTLICAMVAIIVMYSVAKIEIGLQQLKINKLLVLIVGALCVGSMGTVTPAILASGHGALWLVLGGSIGFNLACIVFILKAIASTISLGVGFRGGLFFASMLLGSTLGIIFGNVVLIMGIHSLSPLLYAVIGMAAVSACIIGGPLSMMFLVMDMTSSHKFIAMILLAVIIAVMTVRKTFGYSFATWRFHIRGENLQSALDISQFIITKAENLMRPVDCLLNVNSSLLDAEKFLKENAKDLIVLQNDCQEYMGLIEGKEVYGIDLSVQQSVEKLAIRKNRVLTPGMNIKEILYSFNDVYECSWMVVVRGIDNYQILGLVHKEDVLEHYNQMLTKQINDLTGTKLHRTL